MHLCQRLACTMEDSLEATDQIDQSGRKKKKKLPFPNLCENNFDEKKWHAFDFWHKLTKFDTHVFSVSKIHVSKHGPKHGLIQFLFNLISRIKSTIFSVEASQCVFQNR